MADTKTSFRGIVYSETTAQVDYILQVVEEAGGVVATGPPTFNTSAGINSFVIDENEMLAINNTAYGCAALGDNVSGVDNTAYGCIALGDNVSGSYNTAIGSNTLGGYDGSYNTAIGFYAMFGNPFGNQNVAVGAFALEQNSGGDSNVAVGNGTLTVNSGNSNVAVGTSALKVNSGNNNVVIGCNACSNDDQITSSGSYNTILGSGSGSQLSNGIGSNNVLIGNGTDVSSPSGSNQIVIGSSISSVGDSSITIGNFGNYIYATFTSGSWTIGSDERLKRNVNPDTLGLDFVTDLKPVTFQWKPSNEIDQKFSDHYSTENNKDTSTIIHGLIAQDVKASLEKCNNTTFNGWSEGKDGVQHVSREMFILPLINAIKELNDKFNAQHAQLTSKITELTEQIELLRDASHVGSNGNGQLPS